MRVVFDSEVDILTIILRDSSIVESDEVRDGMIFDYDSQGNVVSIEILDASLQVSNPNQILYELTKKTA